MVELAGTPGRRSVGGEPATYLLDVDQVSHAVGSLRQRGRVAAGQHLRGERRRAARAQGPSSFRRWRLRP